MMLCMKKKPIHRLAKPVQKATYCFLSLTSFDDFDCVGLCTHQLTDPDYFVTLLPSDLYTSGKVDMREVQSKLEAITFKTKMECSYARDPFSSKHLKPSTSEDLLQHIPPRRHVSFQVADSCSLRELPHGRGILKTVTGEFIYSGDWFRGEKECVKFLHFSYLPLFLINDLLF